MSTLINKNVMVGGKRTSMRLEPEMWDALNDICRYENLKTSKICTLVNQRRSGASLTSAMRVFIISYFRAAASTRMNFNLVTQQRMAVLDEALKMRSPDKQEAGSTPGGQKSPTITPNYG